MFRNCKSRSPGQGQGKVTGVKNSMGRVRLILLSLQVCSRYFTMRCVCHVIKGILTYLLTYLLR